MAEGGSVATGYADNESDLNLFFYCSEIPSFRTRKNIYKKIANLDFTSGTRDFDIFTANGVQVKVEYLRIHDTEKILRTVNNKTLPEDPEFWAIDECGKESLRRKHEILKGMQQCLILYDPRSILQDWKMEYSDYPRKNQVALIEALWNAISEWTKEDDFGIALARNDIFHLCWMLNYRLADMLWLLATINGQYIYGMKWCKHWIEQFKIKPQNFYNRISIILNSRNLKKKTEDFLLLIQELHEITKDQIPEAKIPRKGVENIKRGLSRMTQKKTLYVPNLWQSICQRLVEEYKKFPEVRAMVLWGSIAVGLEDDRTEDIDIYAFDNKLPSRMARQKLIRKLSDEASSVRGEKYIDIFHINGIQIHVNHCHIDITEQYLWSKLRGERPKYPLPWNVPEPGELYESRTLTDPEGLVSGWHEMLDSHMNRVKTRTIRRAVASIASEFPELKKTMVRNDQIYFHWQITKILISLFEILFAINEKYHYCYYFKWIGQLTKRSPLEPPNCVKRMEHIFMGSRRWSIAKRYEEVERLLNDFDSFLRTQGFRENMNQLFHSQ